ncbi:MAG: hypothetical protein Q7K26_05080 [bacterium]|nr:hypothetical protein [bacterium]
MVILLTIAFFSTLFFFGWQIARWVLNENRIEHLIAFSGIFGLGLYVFFINIVGLFIPIQTVFYLVLVVFLLFASICFLGRRLRVFGDQRTLEWGISGRWRKILLGSTLFLTLSVGLISFNSHMDLAAARVATAVTMAEGNFPPMEIFNPTDPLYYHYAPDLFSAATYKITGMPIYAAYDLQRAILSGVLFLLGFFLIKLFFLDTATAFFASLSMMYAGTLVFFNGLNGIPALYHKFILGQEIYAPFKFVSDAIVGEYTTPVINSVITQHWGTMAFALMMAVVYIYFFLLYEENRGHHIPAFFAGGFLFALLALVSEPYFAVLGVVIFLFPFVFFLFKRDWTSAKKIFISSFILLSITLLAALFQGGLLRPALAQQLHLSSSKNAYNAVLRTSNQSNLNNNSNFFRVGTPWLLHDGKPIYDPLFLAEFTLLLVVLVPALVFLFKRRFQLALFLTGLLLLFFSVPLLIDSDFPDLAGQLGRFFLPIPLFGGLVIGLVLTTLYRRAQKSLLKGSLLLLAFVLIAQGLWTHSVWVAFGDPPGTWNPNAKFFAQADTLETKAYSWVKKNTTIKDLFLIIKDNYDAECGVSTVPNCLFILNTGRMAPTFMLTGIWGDTMANTSSPDMAALFSEVSKSCDSDILRKLNYSYVYVDGEWSKGMEAKCIKSNELNLMFQISEGEEFIRIYKIEEETHPLSSDSAEANTKQVHQVSQVVTDEL